MKTGLPDSHLLVLIVLEPSLVIQMPDLVLSGPEDGNVVVDDGVLRARRRQLEQDPGLLGAGEFGLIHVVPAVALVVLEGRGSKLARCPAMHKWYTKL